jgi:hypothetical protein
MSDRIRQLEDALAILNSTLTREPHPLLDRELLKIKSSIELHSAVDSETAAELLEGEQEESQFIDAFGTLAVREDGAATFYGRSAGSEVSFFVFILYPVPLFCRSVVGVRSLSPAVSWRWSRLVHVSI